MAEGKMTKVEMLEKAEELVKVYNDQYQTGKFEDAIKTNEELEQVVNEYTSVVRKECFERLAKADDPMLEAVKELTFATIRIKDTKEGEEKIPVRVIEPCDKQIDLLKLHKFVDGGIGVDKNWNYMVEKLNFLMTVQKAIDLGIDPTGINDSYAISELAKEINLGKTPTSKTQILKTVQSIVSAMVGDEYKATSHDVNFLMSVYSKKNRKALTVTCANHKYMRSYMMEICHRIVCEKSYEIDYKKAKNK
ncbi:MAG: hypothetical protein KBS82_05495 [Oscillospiraceae bacterium]|nr:hypothetical protein [Candidatus Limimonas egerieequi]